METFLPPDQFTDQQMEVILQALFCTPEAVELLIGEKDEGQHEAAPAPAPEFHLPMRNVTNINAKNYLVKVRGLDEGLVDLFLNAGDIYEEAKYHNLVFVGRDLKNLPRFAHCRGTADRFRLDVAGSDKSYGFSYQGTGDQLCVFEAPIDLLSFINLFPKDWKTCCYLSLCGVAYKALERYLAEHPNISRVYLYLDSDQAGEEACERIAKAMPNGLIITRMKPKLKGWNEVLLHKKETPAGEHYEVLDMTKYCTTADLVKMIRMSDVI